MDGSADRTSTLAEACHSFSAGLGGGIEPDTIVRHPEGQNIALARNLDAGMSAPGVTDDIPDTLTKYQIKLAPALKIDLSVVDGPVFGKHEIDVTCAEHF